MGSVSRTRVAAAERKQSEKSDAPPSAALPQKVRLSKARAPASEAKRPRKKPVGASSLKRARHAETPAEPLGPACADVNSPLVFEELDNPVGLDLLLATLVESIGPSPDIETAARLRAFRKFVEGSGHDQGDLAVAAAVDDTRFSEVMAALFERGIGVHQDHLSAYTDLLPAIEKLGLVGNEQLKDWFLRAKGPRRAKLLIDALRRRHVRDSIVGTRAKALVDWMYGEEKRLQDEYEDVAISAFEYLVQGASQSAECARIIAEAIRRITVLRPRWMERACVLAREGSVREVVPSLGALLTDGKWLRHADARCEAALALAELDLNEAARVLEAAWAQAERAGLSCATPKGKYEALVFSPLLSGLLITHAGDPNYAAAAVSIVRRALEQTDEITLSAARHVLEGAVRTHCSDIERFASAFEMLPGESALLSRTKDLARRTLVP